MTSRTLKAASPLSEQIGRDYRFRRGTASHRKDAGRSMSIQLVSRNGTTPRTKAWAMWLKLKESKLSSSSPETIAAIRRNHAKFFCEFEEAGL